MRRSLRSFLFPDVNVWIALAWGGHVHHSIATQWFSSQEDDSTLCFCRVTQISFLRLLTTQAVMGSDVVTQAEAWQIYGKWMDDSRIAFLDEPSGLEQAFRERSQRKNAAPKDWADAYLLAFAHSAGLRLVTFDRALQRKTENIELLAPK